MSNFKCFEMEDIAYKEWMEWSNGLDLVANSRTNSWLPAYGYHASQAQELTHSQSDTSSGRFALPNGVINKVFELRKIRFGNWMLMNVTI